MTTETKHDLRRMRMAVGAFYFAHGTYLHQLGKLHS